MMAKYTFVVLTNPVPGKEAEYNEWYNKQHLPDVLNIPGMVCAQRFRLAEDQPAVEKKTHKYLALYEIETNDLPGVFKELASRNGTADMVMSESIDIKNANAAVFAPVADKMMAKDVARPRRAA
jgi:hypothetical protein